MSTYDYKRVIRANDRATMLNLMVGLNGYTLCSGIICEELNGSDYCAVPLAEDESMVIGYIKRIGMMLSPLAVRYLDELKKYEDCILVRGAVFFFYRKSQTPMIHGLLRISCSLLFLLTLVSS